jgi:hypothetical protein
MNRIILGLVVILFFSCKESKKDIIAVDFKYIDNCDENGITNDPFVKYYPTKLYQDTIFGFFNGHGIIPLSEIGKRRYAHNFDIDIKTLKDTFEIEMKNTSTQKIYSYMYYKMKEPVLYSHYLKKGIYRMTSIRSGYRSPLVISIEKYKDSVVVITKQLNRRVDYPFIQNPGPIVFVTPIDPNKANENEILRCKAIQKTLEDSIAKVYRNCNYRLVLNKRVRVSKAVWDSLEILVDSAKFWKSKPVLDLSSTEGNDSRMILEGHSENGYQIRIMPSLHLYTGRYIKAGRDNYDSKNSYTKIFRFIARQTNLKDEDIY